MLSIRLSLGLLRLRGLLVVLGISARPGGTARKRGLLGISARPGGTARKRGLLGISARPGGSARKHGLGLVHHPFFREHRSVSPLPTAPRLGRPLIGV
jgi:hypothetical protein